MPGTYFSGAPRNAVPSNAWLVVARSIFIIGIFELLRIIGIFDYSNVRKIALFIIIGSSFCIEMFERTPGLYLNASNKIEYIFKSKELKGKDARVRKKRRKIFWIWSISIIFLIILFSWTWNHYNLGAGQKNNPSIMVNHPKYRGAHQK